MYGPGSSFLFPGCIAAGKLHPKFNNFKSGPYIRQKSTAFLSFFHKRGCTRPKKQAQKQPQTEKIIASTPAGAKISANQSKIHIKKAGAPGFYRCADSDLYSILALCLLLACCLFTFFDLFGWLPWGAGLSMAPRYYSAALLLVLFLLGLFLPDSHAKLCDHPVLDLLDEVVSLFVLEADGTLVR